MKLPDLLTAKGGFYVCLFEKANLWLRLHWGNHSIQEDVDRCSVKVLNAIPIVSILRGELLEGFIQRVTDLPHLASQKKLIMRIVFVQIILRNFDGFLRPAIWKNGLLKEMQQLAACKRLRIDSSHDRQLMDERDSLGIVNCSDFRI